MIPGKLKKLFPYILILIISGIPLFAHLNSLPIRLWDESRLAMNSYEMYKSDNLLVTQFQGKPDHWNTKPPLLVIMQYGFMKMFGVSELAVRLPSVLAGLGLFLWLLYFFKKLEISTLSAVVTTVLLLISPGYNGEHGLRFGDYDSLLAFVITFQATNFFLYLFFREKKTAHRHLLLFFISIILGVWTKGVAGLILSPLYLIWWLSLRMWRYTSVVKIGLYTIISLAIALSYYLLRETQDPGYLSEMIREEITGRYVSDADQTTQPQSYYLKLLPFQTAGWIIPALLISIISLFAGQKDKRLTIGYLLSCAVFYFLVVQGSDGKNFWYILPVYPFLYATFSMGTESLIRKWIRNPFAGQLGYVILAVLFLGYPFYKTIMKVTGTRQHKDRDYGYYNVTNLLREKMESGDTCNWKYIDTEYGAHNWWYMARMNDHGSNLRYYNHLDSIAPGDMVLIREKHLADSVRSLYVVDRYGPGVYSTYLFKLKEQRH